MKHYRFLQFMFSYAPLTINALPFALNALFLLVFKRTLGWEDLLGKGTSYPLWYSGLENPIDRGAWWTTIHGAAKSQT